jgi:dipeptidyl-peptidase-4
LKITRRCIAFALLFVFLTPTAHAADPATGVPGIHDLLQRIFVKREFSAGRFTGGGRWMQDGNGYTAMEPSAGNPKAMDIVRYSLPDLKREVLVTAAQVTPKDAKEPLRVEDFSWSPDMKQMLIFTNSQRVWRNNTRGDYWVLNRTTGALRKLGGNAPASTLMFAKFSPDGTRVAYVRANNVYMEDVAGGKIRQLTRDGSATIVNGTSDWVYEEEFHLRDCFRWSPDGQRIAYWQFDAAGVKDFPLMYAGGKAREITGVIPYPQYGVYPDVERLQYPLAGTTNSAVRVGVVKTAGGKTTWVKLAGDPRNTYIPRMEWANNSREIILQHMNRQQNSNEVMLADAQSGNARLIFKDEDKAWVDVVDDWKWLHDGREFLWVSERDGWRHAYAVPRDGGAPRLITSGSYDVIGVEGVDKDEQWLYFMASPANATQRYLYRTRLDGSGQAERVTPADQPGTHMYRISPNFQWAFHSYSNHQTPSITELVQLPDNHVVKVLQDSKALAEKLKDVLQPMEFVQVDIGGGLTMDGWLIRPKNFDPAKKYPVLVQIYGEPAAQTVMDRYPGDPGSLFHHALASEGYIIASFDNRGTPAPKGREWRKCIYGAVGVASSDDQAAALKELARTRPYIDLDRVAVWGWSGGGTNTLNLMFRHPELYKVGMAVAPVPDQRLYDTIYQERYMGLPQENPEGYKRGSAINFAEGLKGRLLIVHGSGDDNVHYQGSELLVNRLIELGKPFDFMTYPGRTHGISEGQGTTFHVYSLLARYLEEHLPAGPR